MIWFLTLLLPRALLLMLESWLATISTLLEVIGIQVEPSSPERQLKLQHIDSVKKNKTKQTKKLKALINMTPLSRLNEKLTLSDSPEHC